jgi:hypothetical protein
MIVGVHSHMVIGVSWFRLVVIMAENNGYSHVNVAKVIDDILVLHS